MSDGLSGVLTLVPAVVLVVALGIVVAGLRVLRMDPRADLAVEDLVLLRQTRRDDARRPNAVDRLAAPAVPFVMRLVGPDVLRWLRRTIDLAGRPEGVDLETVVRRVVGWVILVAPLVVVLVAVGRWYVAVLPLAAAVLLPLAMLGRERRLRQEAISRDLPDFLDILSVTVTAGISFRHGLARISERFGGPLAAEIDLTLAQIRNGLPLREAFRRLEQRTEAPEVSTFVTAYVQAEELGAPLGDTLTRIAADLRHDSAQRQRRRAARVAPRVTLISAVVILPGALMLAIVGFFLGGDITVGSLLGEAP